VLCQRLADQQPEREEEIEVHLRVSISNDGDQFERVSKTEKKHQSVYGGI
jgi:hypothetical protein